MDDFSNDIAGDLYMSFIKIDFGECSGFLFKFVIMDLSSIFIKDWSWAKLLLLLFIFSLIWWLFSFKDSDFLIWKSAEFSYELTG